MSLQQEGQRILWQRDDGLSGTATIEVALLPGAELKAQALGGPIQRTEPRPSSKQIEQLKGAARVKTPMAQAYLHRPFIVSSAKTPQWPRPKYDSDLAGWLTSRSRSTANKIGVTQSLPRERHLRRPQI